MPTVFGIFFEEKLVLNRLFTENDTARAEIGYVIKRWALVQPALQGRSY